MVRALVALDHTHYFLDGPRERGITYESLRLLERHLNAKYRHGGIPISVVAIPVPRDELLPRLVEGYGDIAAGALTVTPERRALVDFAAPTVTDVREVVVTGPSGPSDLRRLYDLSGRQVWVRRSSSYRQSLDALNARLREVGAGAARPGASSRLRAERRGGSSRGPSARTRRRCAARSTSSWPRRGRGPSPATCC